MKFTHRPWGEDVAKFVLSGSGPRRKNIFAAPGMGKTGMVYDIFDTMRVFGEAKRLLVLAPRRVAQNSWPEEQQKWSESFGHLSVAVAIGSPTQRTAALKQNADITCINYDNLQWLIEGYGEQWPFDMVAADECFVAGTPVSTCTGSVSIENVRVGDLVLTSFGYRKVNHVFRKTAESLVEVQLVDGARIVCTASHRFWTEAGWKEARELGPSDFLCQVLPSVPEAVCASAFKNDTAEPGEVLFEGLPNEKLSRHRASGSVAGSDEGDDRAQQTLGLVEHRGSTARFDESEAEFCFEGTRPASARGTWRERCPHDPRREIVGTNFTPGLGLEPSCSDKRGFNFERTHVLQTGLRMASPENLLGGGWTHPQVDSWPNTRCQKDFRFGRVGVDRVTHLESRGRTDVFDLEVDGAHEYFAGGVRVHNCTRLKGLRISLQKHHKSGKEFLAGQGGKRSKALASVAHSKVRHWLNLTGSPAPNGLQDLWGQMWFVDGGVRLGRSFTSFSERWFRPVPGTDGYSQIEPLPHAQKEIEALIRDVSITVDPRDYFDLSETFEHLVKVQLPPKARASYREMERQLFTEIQSGNFNFEIEAFNGGGRMAKCLQIGNGAAWCDTERTTWAPIHDEKIEALQSIVGETNGTPLLVRYCNIPDKDRILKAFPRFKFLDNNPQTIKDFQAGRIHGLVTHAASAGHGLSLQDNCWTMVDYSTDCNLEHDEQIIERIGPMRQYQSGYTDRQVKRYRIIAEQTIEERVCLPRIKEKMSLQNAFKEAMKII